MLDKTGGESGAGAAGRFGGAGGAGGNGFGGAGAPVAGASVGVGGTSGLPMRMPDCVADLHALCPASGACSKEEGPDSATYCYESGTKGEVFQPVCGETITDTFYKADGSACFTRTTSLPLTLGCENYLMTWKDSDGATVATGSWYTVMNSGSSHVECSDGGEETLCPGFCNWPSQPSTCSAGTCP